MRRSTLAAGLLFFAFTSVATTDALAFCRSTTCKGDNCRKDSKGCPLDGEVLRWGKLPIHFRFYSRDSRLLIREEARAAIRASFHRWSDTICPDGRPTSLRFVEDEDVDQDKPLELGELAPIPFGIYFRDFGWPHKGVDETLALTTQTFKSSGFIQYADMEVNTGAQPKAGDRRFSTTEDKDGTDLQAVMTHEAGHYIGLAHSREPQSIMAERYCDSGDDGCEKGKVAARRLAKDDIEALCTLYPPDGLPPEEVLDDGNGLLSCSTPAPTSSPRSALSFAWLLALVIPILRWRLKTSASR